MNRVSVAIIGLLSLVLLSSALSPAGFYNGDIAVYLAQGRDLDFSQRTVHVGYLALAALVHLLMGANSLSALGVINVLAGLFMASIVAIRVGKAGLVAWLIVVIAMLPVVSWAEVDLLWMALLVAAVFADHAWVSSICWLMAISVSPVAILAGPILVGLRDEGWRYYLVLTVVSVALLSLIGGLDWWIGDRGVLTAQGVNPLRTLGEWSRYCPWLVVPFVGPWLGRHRAAWAFLPLLLLAPSDVPTWVIPALLMAMAGARAWEGNNFRPYIAVALTIHLVINGFVWIENSKRISREARVIAHMVDELEVSDRFVAPWSLGVRIALEVSGDPYGVRWLAAPDGVRDQKSQWCTEPVGRTAYLPRVIIPAADVPYTVDATGVSWSRQSCNEKLNVVFLIGCTVRRDVLGAYGAQPSATPWLDTLAARGARFTDTIAAAPWTKPAVTALLTGSHPAKLGMVERSDGPNMKALPSSVPTLASRLAEEGYRTLGVSSNPNISSVYGFDTGFDSFRDLSPAWANGVVKVSGDKVVQQALSDLDASSADAPFYLQLLLTDAHAPLSAGGSEATNYRVAVRKMDRALSQLQEGLVARGFTEENTLWVFIADHGEGLSTPVNHGPGHGRYLYPTAVQVPWIVVGPGISAGRVLSGLSSQVDVLPTVLEYLRIKSTGSGGRSWAPLLTGTGTSTSRQKTFTSTWFRNVSRGAVYTTGVACQKDFGSGEQLEERPVFPDGCYTREGVSLGEEVPSPALMRLLERWWRAQSSETEVLNVPVSGDEEKHLQVLGYLDAQ